MKAGARLTAEVRPDGSTRLTEMVGQAPLLLRQTHAQDEAGAAHVHLVGGAAGPIGGDELRFDVRLGPRARAEVRSVAASIALPGPRPCESTLDITVRIEAGASLVWAPEPLIAAEGARHRTTVRVELAEDARLVWHERTLLGRHGERPGSTVTRLRVRRAGRILLDHALAAGPRHPGSLGPAVTAADRASGTTLIVDPAWSGPPTDYLGLAPRDAADGAVAALPLDGPAVLISALAPDALLLARLLEPISRG
ncbi:MAG TPA: urease accessory protein UreD [Actinospica sp.]|nr:urease accessory protein UreD [Actinospica sp.]